MSQYQKHMNAGSASLLDLNINASVSSFDKAISLDPSSFPKQWKRGISLYFAAQYEEGAQQFVTNLEDNPHDVEEVVWACMCDMKRLGLQEAQSNMLTCPKDLRVPMKEIYNLFSGQGNVADVLHRRDSQSAISYGHLYVALYLDCLVVNEAGSSELQHSVGLSPAARRHYRLAGSSPSDDFMGRLSTALLSSLSSTTTSTSTTSETAATTTTVKHQRFPMSTFSSSMVGCWQLSSGHHSNDHPTIEELHQRLDDNLTRGMTTLDMGDIYTGVEESVGRYVAGRSKNEGELMNVEIHTKLVPDLNLLAQWSNHRTQHIVRRSVNRLRKFKTLDLVQFHWWDWIVGDHVEAYRTLCSLTSAHYMEYEGMTMLVDPLVKSVGVTNYDAKHLSELLSAGLSVESNQIQYSLLDRRVEATMVDVCDQHGVRLLCYGTLAGGFLSDRWLGKEDPVASEVPLDAASLSTCLTNRSLIKYYLVLREFGGWTLFQELLLVLRRVADRHGEEYIATVAQAWILSRRRVAGVILGLSGNQKHLSCAVRAHNLAHELDEEDFNAINVILTQSQGPKGPFYEMERVRDGPHGQIMRYNCGELFTEKHAEEFVRRVDELLGKEENGVAAAATEDWHVRSMMFEADGFPTELKLTLSKSIARLKGVFKNRK